MEVFQKEISSEFQSHAQEHKENQSQKNGKFFVEEDRSSVSANY